MHFNGSRACGEEVCDRIKILVGVTTLSLSTLASVSDGGRLTLSDIRAALRDQHALHYRVLVEPDAISRIHREELPLVGDRSHNRRVQYWFITRLSHPHFKSFETCKSESSILRSARAAKLKHEAGIPYSVGGLTPPNQSQERATCRRDTKRVIRGSNTACRSRPNEHFDQRPNVVRCHRYACKRTVDISQG